MEEDCTMSKATIWSYLKEHTTLPEIAIAGIMGNLECESNCEACRKQGDFSLDRSASKEYARQANAGTNNFAYDSIGFGLAQWTYYSRKENLLNSCRSQGKGVEDEEAQLVFMLAEMQTEFTNMWKRLFQVGTIADAAGLVCREYERPAVLNITERTRAGQKIYDEFHGTEPVEDNTAKAIALLEEALALLRS